MKILLRFLNSLLPTETAYAHCDVPCGIYDPKAAQTAAATVKRMVEIIESLDPSNNSIENRNTFVRAVMTKEEHAQKCKEEILILWTDYFKPPHLEKFPDLHDKIWKTARLCSENKQHVSMESAQKLIDAVNEIADIFQQTKAPK